MPIIGYHTIPAHPIRSVEVQFRSNTRHLAHEVQSIVIDCSHLKTPPLNDALNPRLCNCLLFPLLPAFPGRTLQIPDCHCRGLTFMRESTCHANCDEKVFLKCRHSIRGFNGCCQSDLGSCPALSQPTDGYLRSWQCFLVSSTPVIKFHADMVCGICTTLIAPPWRGGPRSTSINNMEEGPNCSGHSAGRISALARIMDHKDLDAGHAADITQL